MEIQRISKLKDIIGYLPEYEFKEKFRTQEECLNILASAKWAEGFICRNCGNDRFCSGRAPFSRRCTRCKRDESATAHTIFQHCRMDLPKAFEIAYLVCGTPDIPASEISQVLETRHMTCLNFKKRVLHCLNSEGNLFTDNK